MSDLRVQASNIQENQRAQISNQPRKIMEQQQQQQEEPNYSLSHLLPKTNQKQKLIQQNIKLKTQIYELALQLDQILQRDKAKKKKYGISAVEDDHEAVKAKKLELKKQELQIVEAKNRIFELKRQLDSVFNNQIVQEREDRLKHITKKLDQVLDERDGLVKVKKGQAKAIKNIKNEEQFKQKIDKVHKQVIRVKEETQKLMEKALRARKEEVSSHQRYVLKKQKIRELQSKLALNEKGMKQKQKVKLAQNNTNNKDSISNELISELEEEIRKLEADKKESEKVWQDKIRNIEAELQSKRIEEEKKLIILREKEKQVKLNEIRIRELRKMVKQNIIEENSKKNQETDMSQFRHKRNIRYIEK